MRADDGGVAVDPICGEAVIEADAEELEYKRRRYFFCSARCRAASSSSRANPRERAREARDPLHGSEGELGRRVAGGQAPVDTAAGAVDGRTSRSLSCSRRAPSHASNASVNAASTGARAASRSPIEPDRVDAAPERRARCAFPAPTVRARAAAPRSANTGSGYPAPNGPSRARSSAARVHVRSSSQPSIRQRGTRSSSARCVAAWASNAIRNASTRERSTVTPPRADVRRSARVPRAGGERVVEVERLDRSDPLPCPRRPPARSAPRDGGTARCATPRSRPPRATPSRASTNPRARLTPARASSLPRPGCAARSPARSVLAIELLRQRARGPARRPRGGPHPRPASSRRPAALMRARGGSRPGRR